MTLEEEDALACRAVALPAWLWVGGMRWRFYLPPHADLWSRYEGATADDQGNKVIETPPSQRGPAIPDLNDPATLGALLWLVRRLYNAPHAHTRFSLSRQMWEVALHHALRRDLCGASEAEALVKALAEAPPAC